MKSRNKNPEKEIHNDGGYGWIIVLSAFAVGFITDGLTFSFGILLVDLLNVFNKGRAITAVIGAIVMGVMHIVGPLAGSLSDRYGCRIVVVVGSLISFVGFIVSAFVPELPYLYVTYGFLGGLGFGLMYLPANVCVIQHFNKRRALATGISVCGSGVGSFVFSLLTRFLLDKYGWRGTILLHAGISLHGVVCGLLFISPDNIPCSEYELSSMKREETEADLIDEKDLYKTLTNYNQCKDINGTDKDALQYSKGHNREVGTNIHNNYCAEAEPCLKNSEEHSTTADNSMITDEYTSTNGEVITKLHEEAVWENNKPHRVKSHKSDQCKTSLNLRSVKTVCCEMVDISLLRDVNFFAFAVSAFLVNLAFIIPFSLLPDQAMETGMDRYEASWLVSSIGITNTLSRIVFGWLGDRAFVNRLLMLVCMLFFAGISTALSPFFVTFATKMVYTSLYGVFIGGFVSLCPVVLADMLGADKFAKSFGIVMFAVGVSGSISTPIGGWIFDQTGNYTISFILAGIELVLAAIVMYIPKMFRRCKMDSNIKLANNLTQL